MLEEGGAFQAQLMFVDFLVELHHSFAFVGMRSSKAMRARWGQYCVPGRRREMAQSPPQSLLFCFEHFS